MKQYIVIGAVIALSFFSCQKETNTAAGKNPNSQKEVKEKPVVVSEAHTPDVDVALNFINGYIDNANKMHQAVGVVEWVEANPLATYNYKAALKKEFDDADMIDADLVFDAQDYDDTGMEVESVDNEGYVVLRGIKWKEFKVKLKLVKQNEKWLVDGCANINIPADKRIRI